MNMEIPCPLVTALRTLTILPVPGREAETPADALSWFPTAGALIGMFLWFVQALLSALIPGLAPSIAAVAVLVASVLLTRGLHLDGLADWADAFWGGWTRERRLEIMKDSALGTFGTVALILTLLAKWSAIAMLLERATPFWIVLACIASRTVQTELAACLPYARAEGGTAAAFVNQASAIHRRNALLTALALTLVFGVFSWRPVILLVIALGAGHAFGHSCRKAFGGVTGDLLGAGGELSETLFLMLAAGIVS